MAETPTIRCPQCSHPIDEHLSPQTASGHLDGNQGRMCMTTSCSCRMTPNLIAVALLFGELTPTSTPARVTRRPDGGWE